MELRSPVSLATLVSFHARLCPKLKSLEPDVLTACLLAFDPRSKDPRKGGFYRLQETFFSTFIVFDNPEWREKGVLLLCQDPETTAAALQVTKAEDMKRKNELEIKGLAPSCIYRVLLKHATQAVVSQDKDRRKSCSVPCTNVDYS